MKYPSDIDKECVHICDAMNQVPGIETIESCCGHGERPFHIWFRAENLGCLPDLLYFFDGCHSGCYHWRICAATDCGRSPAKFLVEGPIGAQAYEEAVVIADYIIADQAKGAGR